MNPAADHFRLWFYAAILQLLNHLSSTFGSLEAVFQQFPFLAGYNDELAAHGMNGLSITEAARHWRDYIAKWELDLHEHLPLRALGQSAAIDPQAIIAFLTVGLIEEDWRFGQVFEALQGGPHVNRPTLGLLSSWLPLEDGDDPRVAVKQLIDLGLIASANADAPRQQRTLHVPPLLWEAARGDGAAMLAPWLRYQPLSFLPELEQVIVTDEVRAQLAAAAALLNNGRIETLVVRGPANNGRRFATGAVARALGRGLLEARDFAPRGEPRWSVLGPLSAMLHALPCVALEPGSGETAEVPNDPARFGPLAVVLGRHGGLTGGRAEKAITLQIGMPDPALRRRIWTGFECCADPDSMARQFRLTTGNLQCAATLAQSYSALDSRDRISAADVRQACRSMHRQALDTLAAPLPSSEPLLDLAVAADTGAELRNLILRCRFRENLGVPSGVRALFKGPSGTGKTLAARVLAAELDKDAYRVDLSNVVNKYIGETEKNLNQIFSRAEELDVVLLLDEGDALLTQRTGVQSSNDRYANLETNYLLQRVESFEGILIVTTNAGDRIDSAFQRRMDVVVDFRLPEIAERWAIWQIHLRHDNSIDPTFLSELAKRCNLTGGQIRNAVLHGRLLALDASTAMTSAHLHIAVEREYRKSGGVCPLRAPGTLAAVS